MLLNSIKWWSSSPRSTEPCSSIKSSRYVRTCHSDNALVYTVDASLRKCFSIQSARTVCTSVDMNNNQCMIVYGMRRTYPERRYRHRHTSPSLLHTHTHSYTSTHTLTHPLTRSLTHLVTHSLSHLLILYVRSATSLQSSFTLDLNRKKESHASNHLRYQLPYLHLNLFYIIWMF